VFFRCVALHFGIVLALVCLDIYEPTQVPYVHSKFVGQDAVGIYYIPLPAKKIAAQNLYTSLSARNCQKLCSLHSQLAKAGKK